MKSRVRPIAAAVSAVGLQTTADAIRTIGVTEVTYYRWRKEFGGLKADQVKRLRELETENSRLRKAVAESQMLQGLPDMARIVYARVSSSDQDHGSQEARLKAAGCDVIRAEKVSGKSREGRDELATVMDFIRPGDDLVVVKLDRLGRSTRNVLNLVHELEGKGAALTVLDPAFSIRDATGPMLVTVLGMAAEMERKFIRERQQTGIEAAKARGGVYTGRKATAPVDKVREMHAAGIKPTEIAKATGLSRMHVYRLTKAVG